MDQVNSRLPALRPWQVAALTEWRGSNRRGIVAAATGTGKTRVAVEALRDLDERWIGVVVAPTKALQAQWVGVLSQALSMHPARIGTLGGDRPSLQMEQRLVVSVLNSARDRLPDLVNHWHSTGQRVLLVVDECHRAGAKETAASLWSVPYDSTLGLSATPERGDDGLDDVLVPALGPVLYRYPLVDALDDGVLSSFACVNLYLDLDEISLAEYREIEARIRGLGSSANAASLTRLRAQQDQILRRAGGRTVAMRGLLGAGLLDARRSLLFHETIEQAESTSTVLQELGIPHALEHSKLAPDARTQALRRFGSGSVETLVTVKALDEGIDVPEANLAVIFSGTMNARQRIQRAGRIVRPSGSGATLVSLLARNTAEELEVGARDAELFGASRVNHLGSWDPTRATATTAFIRSLA